MRATVRVPATSANLGPGFDCLGLALDLCNEVTADADVRPGVSWEGEGATELPVDGSDRVSRSMAAVAERVGVTLPPLALSGLNRIPVERGLGSSAAAAVAGVVLASVVLDLGIHEDPTSVFSLAAEIEGHPDNAAPAAFGGLTVAAGGVVRRLDPHPELRPVVLVPGGSRLSTSDARAALPAEVSFGDAAENAAHAALAVVALTREPSLLAVALRDRLHQRVRLSLVPDVETVFDDLVARGIPVCVSGAGPSLLAFVRGEAPAPTELGVDGSWRVLSPGVRPAGFELIEAGP